MFEAEAQAETAGGRLDDGAGASAGWRWAALVLLLTAAAYFNTLSFQFVYDDTLQIVQNPAIHSWRNLPQYFTGNVWSHLSTSVYYRPLFLTWLLLNYELFGLNPLWWHATTVLAHLAATGLVFMLARRLTRDEVAAVVASLIFGLHPVHVEVVAWVSGVTESLLAVCFIATFLCFLREREAARAGGRRASWLAPSLLIYAAALLFKETAVVLPAVVFAYEWIYGAPDDAGPAPRLLRGYAERARGAFAVAAPYLALSLVYLLVRAFVLKSLVGTATQLPLPTVVLTLPSLVWLYVRHLLWPFNLSIFYDTPYVAAPGLRDFVLPLLAVCVLAAALFYWARRSRVVALASVWLALPLVPALKITAFMPGDIFHDRYLYLPSVGFSIIAAHALRRIDFGAGRLCGLPAAQAALALALAVLLGAATAAQSRHWATNLQLYTRALAVTPKSRFATQNMAADLAARGFCRDAVPMYEQVLAEADDLWNVHYGLGVCLYQTGKYEKSNAHLDRAIELAPRNPAVRLQKGLTLMASDRLAEAEAEVRSAISFQNEDQSLKVSFGGAGTGTSYLYHLALADILRKRGDLRAALAEYRRGVDAQPDEKTAAAARRRISELEAALGATPR